MQNISAEIQAIKRQLGDKLCIMGHHYQNDAVVQHCDITGDSLELARRVPGMDDRVDFLFNELYGEIVALVMSDPTQIHRANQLEWALHNLERSADRTINICEWVIYMITGVYAEMSTGEYEAPPGD